MSEFDEPLPIIPRTIVLVWELYGLAEWVGKFVFPSLAEGVEQSEKSAEEVVGRIRTERQKRNPRDESDYAEDFEQQQVSEVIQSEAHFLEQHLVNSLFVQLYHLVEHQLDRLATELKRGPVTKRKGENDLAAWFRRMEIDKEKTPTWQQVDRLRRIANTLKHPNARNRIDLKESEPNLFDVKNRTGWKLDLGTLASLSTAPTLFLNQEDFIEAVKQIRQFYAEIDDVVQPWELR